MIETKDIDNVPIGGYVPLSARKASAVARAWGVKRPRNGYEVSLDGKGLWLCSTGHHQFGWFGRENGKPFELRRYR